MPFQRLLQFLGSSARNVANVCESLFRINNGHFGRIDRSRLMDHPPPRQTSSRRRLAGNPAASSPSFLWTFLTYLLFGAVCFQLGFVFGGGERVWSYISSEQGSTERSLRTEAGNAIVDPVVATTGHTATLPDTVRGLFPTRTTLPRDEFIKAFDIGVPWDPSVKGSTDVLLFYSSEPDSVGTTVAQATKNCDILKVVLTKPNQKNQCLAVVPQWDSYHVHKFMRLKEDANKSKTRKVFDTNHPLRYVSRRHELNGKQVQFPVKQQTNRYWKMLQDYLRQMDDTFERLKPLAAQVAGQSKTVVVLVVNFGQSELLFNFVCNARAKGLDLSKILVFATDEDASELAKSLDIAVFFVSDAFGDMPTKAAGSYGDKTFQHMMFSKVYCVHMINAMGYDVLFQDVDVIWYKDPLPFFQLPEAGDFDFYFQDDGAHSSRYAPYSPNSGFYYIRFNERTQYFFQDFIRKGDLIIASGSHQSVMNEILTDHASSRGLRTKVFGRDSPLGLQFPGGFHYHKRKNFMKAVLQMEESPYIFHMSWTQNKLNKRLFYQQMGEWYVEPQCVDKRVGEFEGPSLKCCAAAAIIKCHYRDKPSKRPCTESDPIDKNGKSFW